MADNVDKQVDETLEKCISEGTRKSFFLFAGAGSGKTYSLVLLLNKIRDKWQKKLNAVGKQVAVITYTNAATDEIIRRLGTSPLFHISTIHSFVWDVVSPFQTDIKKYYIQFKTDEFNELQSKIERARKESSKKSYQNDAEKVEEKIDRAKKFNKFIYNPNGNNNERNSLNHADVIKIAAAMIAEKPLLREIIAQQYPFLLIDESQDTKKELIDAFFKIADEYKDTFTLGLLGDQKQRIYTDGKEHIETIIPAEWDKPVKKMNFRCDKRIVELGNEIGNLIDNHAHQEPRDDAQDGYVRLFLIQNHEGLEKKASEMSVISQMRDITGDELWMLKEDNIKILTIEHMMAARRLGFADFYGPMKKVSKYSQSLLQGLVGEMDVFTKQVFPFVESLKGGNNIQAMNILKQYSPLIKNLPSHEAYKNLNVCRNTAKELAIKDFSKTTIRKLIAILNKSQIFEVDPLLTEASLHKAEEYDDQSDADEVLVAWVKVMDIPAIQIKLFDDYVNHRSIFDTHQGVKGLEFDRVLVIIDENESNQFLFNYNKILGVEDLSATDMRNKKEGKDSSIERTLRLFYVVCTRAKHSLAVVMYTDNPEKAKDTAISNNWFHEDEIIIQ